MHRLLRSLLVVLLVSAAFAGCFGGDGDDDDDPSPTPTTSPTPTNNTTGPANIAPVPVIKVSVEAGGEPVEGPPFLVLTGVGVNVTFDASESTDPDGEIEQVAWEVSNTVQFRNNSQETTFTADLGPMSRDLAGVYTVTLRVIDDKGTLNELTRYFVIDYHVQVVDDQGMFLPGASADRQAAPQDSHITDTPPLGRTGSFAVYPFTLQENATEIDVDVTYTSGVPSGELKVYLFEGALSNAETQSGTPAAEEGPGASPLSLSHPGDPLTPGSWTLRLDLAGTEVTDFTVDIIVRYTAPDPLPPLGGGDGNDTGEANGTETAMPVPNLPPLPPEPVPARSVEAKRDGSA